MMDTITGRILQQFYKCCIGSKSVSVNSTIYSKSTMSSNIIIYSLLCQVLPDVLVFVLYD